MTDSETSLTSLIQSPNERVHVSGIRCFDKPQSARLGNITVLVGDNSTGKSTFLAVNSMLNLLLDPYEINFNEEPFILGSYRDIATVETNKGGNREAFSIGLEGEISQDHPMYHDPIYLIDPDLDDWDRYQRSSHQRPYKILTSFISKSGQPTASKTDIVIGTDKLTIDWITDSRTRIKSISIGTQTVSNSSYRSFRNYFNPRYIYPELFSTELDPTIGATRELSGEDRPNRATCDALRELSLYTVAMQDVIRNRTAYAFAPVRSMPKRTYDPVQSFPMSEGGHVPMILSRIFREDRDKWVQLKQQLEKFGEQSGLFREISVRPLGESASDPFQLTVRVRDKAVNLLDVGYGVSQILPIIVDPLIQRGTRFFLLQQPEVHLHPRGQAALATFLLDQTQDSNRRFIVETHSDQIIDRLRIEVRDRKLDPEIVSLLYFEQGRNGVRIHEIELDSEGNLTNAPSSYRDFFLNEEYSLLGIQR